MFALIGETLRRLRREKRLTLEQLSETAGLGRGQLSRIENSHQEATLSTLAKILGAQGVSRQEFFRRYDLVESEANVIERQQGSGAPSGQADWPREIQEVLGRFESFVNTALHQPAPVAQGAIEVGDLVVLFRVVPKNASPAPSPSPEPAASESKPARRQAKRKR